MSRGTAIGAGVGLVVGIALMPYGIGVAGIVFAIGLGAGVGSLLDPLKQPAPGRPEEEALNITTSVEGIVIPEVLGCQKLTGNLLSYWGHRKEEKTQEQGGKKGGKGGGETVVGYTYHLSWLMGVCTGPVTSVLAIYANNTCVWAGNAPQPTEEELAEGIWYREIWVGMAEIADEYAQAAYGGGGGKKGGGGGPDIEPQPPGPLLRGRVLIFYGIPEQQILPLPDAAWTIPPGIPLSYNNQCVIYFDDCEIGQSLNMPSVFVVLAKVPPNFDECRQAVNRVEYNPSWAIYYILTKMVGFPPEYLNHRSFRAAANWLNLEDLGVNILMNQSTSCLVWIDTILRHIDATMVWGSEGTLEIKLLRGGEITNMAVVDEDVVLDAVEFTRPGWIETINQYKVLYPQRMDCFCEPTARQEPTVKGMSFSAGQYGTGCGIWMWGDNQRGETGVGNFDQTQWEPRSVTGIDPWTMQPFDFIGYWNFGYAAPLCSSTAIGQTCEALWTWGSGNWGQSGNGTWVNNNVPTMVLPPDGDPTLLWGELANGLGAWHFCALDVNGHAHCWGYNVFGALGDGTYDPYHGQDKNTPTRVLGNHSWEQISVGFHQTHALKDGGQLWSWGGNQWGELGIGSPGTLQVSSPVQANTTVRFLNVYASNGWAVALSEDHKVWAWGTDEYGQIGQDALNDQQGTEYHTPMSVITDMQFRSVVAGISHCVALAYDGSVWCWGSNVFGECGQDTNPWIPDVNSGSGGAQDLHWYGTPVSVKGGHSFKYIGAGYFISYGIKEDGTIWFWGQGIYGGIDWTGKSYPVTEDDIGKVGFEEGDQTGKWASEDTYGINEMVVSYPTESMWYRELQTPAGYNRQMNNPGVWYYHNDQYSFDFPEGCYWVINLSIGSPITITAELLSGSGEWELRSFWDGRLASGDDSPSIDGYTVDAYHAISTGSGGDTLIIATTAVTATKCQPLMYWIDGNSGYRIKYELAYNPGTTTTTV